MMCYGSEPDDITFVVPFQECGRTIKTVGRKLLSRTIYSRKLREYVLECLAWDPEDRPPATILLKRIQEALRPYENPDDPDNPPEWPSPFGYLIGEDGLDRGTIRAGPLHDPSWMVDVDEDSHDYDDTQLLFPSRHDLEHGIRQMPFERGRNPPRQTFNELMNAFRTYDRAQQAGFAEENDNNYSMAAQHSQPSQPSQPIQPHQHIIVISSSEGNSDGDDDRPDPSPRRAYEARIESIRSRPPQIGRPSRGRWAMKGARRQPASRVSGGRVVKRASGGAQAGRANQPAPPPPERRPGSEIAQDSVFNRAQAQNVTLGGGGGGGSAALRAQLSRVRRAFEEAGDDLPDYEVFNPPSQEPQ
jgi:hypothetical protein